VLNTLFLLSVVVASIINPLFGFVVGVALNFAFEAMTTPTFQCFTLAAIECVDKVMI
jgi:predicted acyltransferase